MSVRQNKETGKWEVRLTVDRVRKRYGSYDTEAIGKAKELSIIKLNEVMQFEQPDQKASWFKKPKWNRMPFKAFGNRGK